MFLIKIGIKTGIGAGSSLSSRLNTINPGLNKFHTKVLKIEKLALLSSTIFTLFLDLFSLLEPANYDIINLGIEQ